MSMHYEANVLIQVTGESVNLDCSDLICKAFKDNSNGGTENHEVSTLGEGRYRLEYYGNSYSEWKSIFRYCKKLAVSLTGDMTVEGSIFNEGSGGNYSDSFTATSDWKKMVFQYWCEGDTDRRPDVWEEFELNKSAPVRTDFDYSDPTLTVDNIPNDGRTTMIIPPHIKSLHSGFSILKNLHELVIPDTITSFPFCSLRGCDALEKLVLNGAWFDPAFNFKDLQLESLPNLKEIELNGCGDKLKEYTIVGCESLHKVLLPDTVMYFAPNAFVGCANLTEVNIPKSLKAVFDNSIVHCPNLNMEFGPEVKVIKTAKCAEYKEQLYEIISCFDDSELSLHCLSELFNFILTAKEWERAEQKIAKIEGVVIDRQRRAANYLLVEYFSKMHNKGKLEQAMAALFTEKMIEKMKTKFAMMMGQEMGKSINEISDDLGMKLSTADSYKLRWGFTYFQEGYVKYCCDYQK